MTKIMKSWRQKIYRLYPSAKFEDVLVLGCTPGEFADFLQARFEPGMSWETYPEKWWVVNSEPLNSVELMRDPAKFYAFFNFKSYMPRWVEEVGGRLANFRGRQPVPEGVVLRDGTILPPPKK